MYLSFLPAAQLSGGAGIPCCPLSFLWFSPAILAWHYILCTQAGRYFATKNRSKGGMNLGGMWRQSPGPRNASDERAILSVLFPPLVLNKEGMYIQTGYEKKSGQCKAPLPACCFQILASQHHDSRPLALLLPRVPVCANHQSLTVSDQAESPYFCCTGIYSTRDYKQ